LDQGKLCAKFACCTDIHLYPTIMAAPAVQCTATADLDCKPDLGRLCDGFINCELKSRRNAPLLLVLRKPECRVRVRDDGTMLLKGKVSAGTARHLLRKVARRCSRIHEGVRLKHFKVEQMIHTCRLGFLVNLRELANKPGAIPNLEAAHPRVRVPCYLDAPDDPENSQAPMQADVYSGGKLRISGAQTEEALHQAYEAVLPTLRACECEDLAGAYDLHGNDLGMADDSDF